VSCVNTTTNRKAESGLDKEADQFKLISFSKGNLRDSTVNAPVFTNRFVLNKDEFMSLHFELEQPLIESLHALAPDLSEEALLNQGNFQFSILVDDKIAYVENLNKGAGLVASKTTQLEHTVPLITQQPIDFWGWFMWLKFMKMAGGRDLFTEGSHSLRIELRAYLQNDGLKVSPLLATGSLDVEVAALSVEQTDITIQEIKAGSGWKLSNDTYNISKMEALNTKIAQKRFEKVNGIVVVKNGKLLIEEYFNGAGRDSLHDPKSVGKTIASAMIGMAIDDGYIRNEDLQLKDFYDIKSFANYSIEKEAVSIRSLLTMTSGFEGDDNNFDSPGNEENMYPTDDWVQFVLDLPIDTEKEMGADYTYFTGGAMLLGDIIHQSVPGGLVAYSDAKLFSPLGITNYRWEFTPQGVGNTAGGIRLRALDFAKFGQLYKNKGSWNGKRLLKESWVYKSLSKQVEQPNRDRGYYGYLFWNKVYTVAGKDYEVSFCTGNGGNKIIIFKDIPFVVVITASGYNLPYMHSDVDLIMTEYILPAVLNQ
jgi:CubicO group peptidase (beta-lactamase class C family)